MNREKVEPTGITRHEIIQGDGEGRESLIEGAIIRPLVVIPDDRGHFAEVFRTTDPIARGFEFRQTSITRTRAGVIKAFHYHLQQEDIFLPMASHILGERREELSRILGEFDASKIKRKWDI